MALNKKRFVRLAISTEVPYMDHVRHICAFHLTSTDLFPEWLFPTDNALFQRYHVEGTYLSEKFFLKGICPFHLSSTERPYTDFT